MHRMDWDTRKPDNVSRRVGVLRRIDTHVNKHNDDSVHHDDPCGAPKEHCVLRDYVSHLSGVEHSLVFSVSRICLPWSEVETLGNRAPGKTFLWSRARVGR